MSVMMNIIKHMINKCNDNVPIINMLKQIMNVIKHIINVFKPIINVIKPIMNAIKPIIISLMTIVNKKAEKYKLFRIICIVSKAHLELIKRVAIIFYLNYLYF